MPPHLAAFFMKIKINIPAITIEAKPNTIVYNLCMYVASYKGYNYKKDEKHCSFASKN